MTKVYVLWSESCSDCGSTASIKVLSTSPTVEEIERVKCTRGWCALTRVVEVERSDRLNVRAFMT